jgi:hypothetical protein
MSWLGMGGGVSRLRRLSPKNPVAAMGQQAFMEPA